MEVILIPAGIILGLLLLWMYITKKGEKEYYRDPIFLDPIKMNMDYYPRANGTIYGPYANIFSGHPYYWKVN